MIEITNSICRVFPPSLARPTEIIISRMMPEIISIFIGRVAWVLEGFQKLSNRLSVPEFFHHLLHEPECFSARPPLHLPHGLPCEGVENGLVDGDGCTHSILIPPCTTPRAIVATPTVFFRLPPARNRLLNKRLYGHTSFTRVSRGECLNDFFDCFIIAVGVHRKLSCLVWVFERHPLNHPFHLLFCL